MQRLGLPADNDTVMDPNQAAIALAMAMNQARMDLSDREGVKSEARTYGAARLEALRKKLAPLYAAIPRDVEMFDLGLVAQDKPRLFVDIIAFIEMNRDQTAYRFLQETRAGRVTLAETGDDKVIIDHVTRYVARRLVEREKALAAEGHFGSPSPVAPEKETAPIPAPALEKLPKPELPRAATALPMTAAEAFRQWTRPAQETAPLAGELPAARPVSAVADAVVPASAKTTHEFQQSVKHQSSEPPQPLAAAVQPSMMAAAEPLEQARRTVETLVHAVPDTKKPEAETAPASSFTKAAVATAAAATMAAAGSTVVRTSPTIKTHRNSTGWWVWPLLALLIGVGLGALALYLYAASLAR
jgi:hypothetical protein